MKINPSLKENGIKRMKNITAVFLLFMGSLLLPLSGGSAVPQTINYQGHLASSGGTSVNAAVDMTFTIYNAATSGTNFWSEAQTVQVNNGVYAVALGAITPIDPAIIDGDLWLGVKAGVDAEMTPRQKLNSVPFAMTANRSLSERSMFSYWGSNVCPSGTDLVFSGVAVTAGTNSHGPYCVNIDGLEFGAQTKTGAASSDSPMRPVGGMTCAICTVDVAVVYENLGSSQCPNGDVKIYDGTTHYLYNSDMFCLDDKNPVFSSYGTNFGSRFEYYDNYFDPTYSNKSILCSVCGR